ncbi:putative glucosylceramidase 3 [Anoplophora glabripennis]|uniref:putative glucosylceramidase 3 n=1 Tax=Anoplophora glabripennis TaxID=217634 RepID=UPI0008758889|nr:putative glucosylceramidase 3 [Anoplophora glabripennis]
MVSTTVLLVILTGIVVTMACNIRKEENGFICVCNASYCDTVPEVQALRFEQYQLYSTGKFKPGLNTLIGKFSEKRGRSQNIIKVNIEKRYQKIIGFGGAFTDATGININSLDEAVQENLLESYFGKNGIEYNLCRVPIGGTDFSPRPYTYDDYTDDTKLEHFKLQEEDLKFKIPFIRAAKKLRGGRNLKLFASAWTAPIWMKTNNVFTGYSLLKEEYYQLWADYVIKFFDQYRLHNITYWGMTTGNEPMDGFITYTESKINAMGWVPLMLAKWINENLGPNIHRSPYEGLKIIIHDDARLTLPYVVPLLLNESLKYIDGVGVHWYWDDRVPADVLNLIKTDKKEVFLLSTESCIFREGLTLGSWDRAARYIGSIIEYLENNFGGWLDWNMALDTSGGPTYIGYEADSPILVNASSQEFYKQPMFYAMGHFSKFIVPDSVRLETSYTSKKDGVKSMAFLRPDNLIAVVIFNNGTSNSKVQIQRSGIYSNLIDVEAKSIYTVLFPVGKDVK